MISRQHLKAHLITVYVNSRGFVLFHLKKQRIEKQRRKKELTEDGKESYSKTTFSERSLWARFKGRIGQNIQDLFLNKRTAVRWWTEGTDFWKWSTI